jgi:hypothetical protein
VTFPPTRSDDGINGYLLPSGGTVCLSRSPRRLERSSSVALVQLKNWQMMQPAAFTGPTARVPAKATPLAEGRAEVEIDTAPWALPYPGWAWSSESETARAIRRNHGVGFNAS